MYCDVVISGSEEIGMMLMRKRKMFLNFNNFMFFKQAFNDIYCSM